MRIEIGSAHITAVGVNIFSDLGFEASEARMLQAASQRAIANKLKTKEVLVTELVAWTQSGDQPPEDTARVLDVTQLGIADLLNKKLTTLKRTTYP